jgi:hypothetical protein
LTTAESSESTYAAVAKKYVESGIISEPIEVKGLVVTGTK